MKKKSKEFYLKKHLIRKLFNNYNICCCSDNNINKLYKNIYNNNNMLLGFDVRYLYQNCIYFGRLNIGIKKPYLSKNCFFYFGEDVEAGIYRLNLHITEYIKIEYFLND